MSTNVQISEKPKGIKATILLLAVGEDVVYPRKRYSTTRSSVATAKIENPERDWKVAVIPDGIRVICTK